MLLVTLGIGVEPGYAMIRASEASVSASQTIVRKVAVVPIPASHRFVLLFESEVRNRFAFQAIGVGLTMAEVCAP